MRIFLNDIYPVKKYVLQISVGYKRKEDSSMEEMQTKEIEQNDALHHRVVVALDTGDQQAAHARDAVEALDVDGADHSVQEGGGNILHQRHHCVAEDVAQGDVVLTHALGTGKADIVLEIGRAHV